MKLAENIYLNKYLTATQAKVLIKRVNLMKICIKETEKVKILLIPIFSTELL